MGRVEIGGTIAAIVPCFHTLSLAGVELMTIPEKAEVGVRGRLDNWKNGDEAAVPTSGLYSRTTLSHVALVEVFDPH